MTKEMPPMETHISEFAPEKIKIVVFDVDDTVTRGTLGIKTAVWEEIFSDRLDKLEEAREIYEHTGKGDRYNMIAHVVGEPQENCRENSEVISWANKFESLTSERIREHGIHEDDIESLVELRNGFSGPIYLLSVTPQAALEGNINHFEELYPEIKGMFTAVIGTPLEGGKAGELDRLANENGIDIDQVLMVGDGGSDYKGASGSGSQFVGVIQSGNEDKWPDQNFPKISSVSELPDLLVSLK